MKNIKLLLVDDEQEFRAATSAALTRRGFTIIEAENGEQALDLIAANRPEVIVLDLRMDGMSGIEVLTEIRKSDKEVPVIILTGHGQLDDAVAGVQLGIVDFLQKPVDVDRLAIQIRQLISNDKREPLREKKIGELMIPLDTYPRIYDDQTMSELVPVLRDSVFSSSEGKVTEQGHRTVLIFNRREEFVGCLRISDVLSSLFPPGLRGSPYSSYLTGMFAGQCKMVGKTKIRDLVAEQLTIDVDTPLMEAVYSMVTNHVINLPVLKEGNIVGILRDKDLLAEASRYFTSS